VRQAGTGGGAGGGRSPDSSRVAKRVLQAASSTWCTAILRPSGATTVMSLSTELLNWRARMGLCRAWALSVCTCTCGGARRGRRQRRRGARQGVQASVACGVRGARRVAWPRAGGCVRAPRSERICPEAIPGTRALRPTTADHGPPLGCRGHVCTQQPRNEAGFGRSAARGARGSQGEVQPPTQPPRPGWNDNATPRGPVTLLTTARAGCGGDAAAGQFPCSPSSPWAPLTMLRASGSMPASVLARWGWSGARLKGEECCTPPLAWGQALR